MKTDLNKVIGRQAYTVLYKQERDKKTGLLRLMIVRNFCGK